jgi:transmembrane sensor
MRQVSRWYDIDVVYDGDMPTENFSAKFQEAAAWLMFSGFWSLTIMKFVLEGKTVKYPIVNNIQP